MRSIIRVAFSLLICIFAHFYTAFKLEINSNILLVEALLKNAKHETVFLSL